MKYTVLIICGLMLCAFHPWVRLRYSLLFASSIVLFLLCGCAALPMPLQPQAEQYNSNQAEGAWLVLDGVDTLYTMHMRKGTECDHEGDPLAAHIYGSQNPPAARVLGINLLLALGHTMVTSWLDDEVAKHDKADDGSVGPWYVGRIVWHTASILYSGIGAYEGHSHGCSLL